MWFNNNNKRSNIKTINFFGKDKKKDKKKDTTCRTFEDKV